MKQYSVLIPVLLSVSVSIEADNEKEAIEKAVKQADFNVKVNDSDLGYELHEWSVYDKISQGNYYHGHICEADAQEEEY